MFLSRWQLARESFECALSLEPSNLSLLNNIAVCTFYLGNLKEVRHCVCVCCVWGGGGGREGGRGREERGRERGGERERRGEGEGGEREKEGERGGGREMEERRVGGIIIREK